MAAPQPSQEQQGQQQQQQPSPQQQPQREQQQQGQGQQQEPQQGQQQGQQQPRQQVSVDEALDTLAAMFESVDRDVIHMILIEGCGGNMEGAVEALLSMTGGITGSAKSAAKPPQPVASSSSSQQQQQRSPQSGPQAAPPQDANAVNLADDFLRPPSYFLAKYENDHDYDFESAQRRQMIEDELFAKALFEDSLFSTDLQKNPEWILEAMEQQGQAQSDKNSKKESKPKFQWKGQYGSQFQESDIEHAQVDLNNINPSDVNARRLSFKQRFNGLGDRAKQKLGVLAHKLQRNKQEQSGQKQHQYSNILTSLDDETLIDHEEDANNNAIIEVASEDNRGTYQAPFVPNKPQQNL